MNDYNMLSTKFESYYRDLHDIKYLCGQALRTITGRPRKKVDFPCKRIPQHVEDFLITGVWDKSINCLPVTPLKKADKNSAYIIECEANDIIKLLDKITSLVNAKILDDPILAGLSRDEFPKPVEIKNLAHLFFAIESTIKQLAAHAQQVRVKMNSVKAGAAARKIYANDSLERVKSALDSFGGIEGFRNSDKRPEQYRNLSKDKIYDEISVKVNLSPERVKSLIGNLI
jgi:hypothetical protein